MNPNLGIRANLFRRWIALLLDSMLLVIGFILIGMMAKITEGYEIAKAIIGLIVLLSLVRHPIAYLVMLSKGLTPGKWIMGLRVADAQTGNIPGFCRMFLREVIGRMLSGMFFGLGYFWALFDKSSQCWHDKLAGTVVLHKKISKTINT